MPGIDGKIAKIVDAYTVVINKGHENGVEEGMRFIIYESGEEIEDPDTHEPLGKLEYVKAKVKVSNVAPKVSTAISDESIGMASRALVDMYATSINVVARELPLDGQTRLELTKKIIGGVKIGDLVRQILD